jgi:hypothetical protein
MVMTAWLHQGVYGKMTQSAAWYQLSRTLRSPRLFMANLQWATLLSDAKLLGHKAHGPFAPRIVL